MLLTMRPASPPRPHSHQDERVMKHLVVLLIAGGMAGPAAAGGTVWTAGPGSSVWIDGDSTLHAFRGGATLFTASFARRESGGVTGRVVIPVVALCSESEGLDSNLRRALRAREYPEIVFSVTAGGG